MTVDIVNKGKVASPRSADYFEHRHFVGCMFSHNLRFSNFCENKYDEKIIFIIAHVQMNKRDANLNPSKIPYFSLNICLPVITFCTGVDNIIF